MKTFKEENNIFYITKDRVSDYLETAYQHYLTYRVLDGYNKKDKKIIKTSIGYSELLESF